jgi:hypothetical protein
LVVAVTELNEPHAPGGLGLPVVKVTTSFATGFAPTPVVTVAVMVDVLVPSARMLLGFAETATLLAT